MRYGMLESLHQFANQQLMQVETEAERDALHHRHLAWLLRYAAGAGLNGPDQEAWLDLLEAEQDNFLAALEWGLRQPGGEPSLELAGSLAPFWVIRGHIGPGRRWLDAALTTAGPQADPRLRARALDGAGQLSSVQADYDSQRVCQEQSLAIWRELGDDSRTARCLGDLGAADHVLGEYRAARAKFTESLELARRAGDVQQVARSLSGLGRIAMHQNDLAQAEVYFAESASRARQAGDLRLTTLVLGNHGVVAYNQGDFAVAKLRFTENLANATRLGDRKLMAGALTNLGSLAHATGDPDGAAGLHAQALALSEQVGDRRIAAVALINLGLAALARGDQAAARRYHGRSLDLAVAISEPRSIAENLEELAGVDTAAGLADRAVALYSAAQAIREGIASPALGPDAVRIEQAAATLRHALGADRYAAAQTRGRAMTEDEAIALAREVPA